MTKKKRLRALKTKVGKSIDKLIGRSGQKEDRWGKIAYDKTWLRGNDVEGRFNIKIRPLRRLKKNI